jgi:predicted trehalose synthase
LSDIAQTVRSFDYVAMTTLLYESDTDPAWAAWWSRVVSAELVAVYLDAVADSPLVPDDIEAIDALLNALAMSRALRELDWELTVRPEWTAVHLAGVRRMLGVLSIAHSVIERSTSQRNARDIATPSVSSTR